MKRIVVSSLIACAILAAPTYGQQSNAQPATSAAATSTTIGLKDAFAGKYLIGTASDLTRVSEADKANIKANYNIITPENCMKPDPTHPSEERYTFTTPDAMVKWCEENNIKVWGHTLLWHSQTGRWFFEGPNGQPATREQALEKLKKHIFTVAGRYKGRVMGWDVVNEAIEDRQTSGSESLRNRSWYKTVGPDVITLAFKWAHEADPNAQLYYNDYNIEQGAARGRGKHAASMLLLRRLIKEGAPINGVGIQGHWSVNTNLADIEQAITDYESLGLKVSISELDVTIAGENSGAFNQFGGRVNASPEAFKKQAEVYAKMFEIFNKHSKSISRVTLWGLSDRRSWKSPQYPLVFDGQMKPKPAYYSIINVGLGKNETK